MFTKMGDSLPWMLITIENNLTLLALSSAEKSITVQTKKHTTNSN